MRKGDLAKLTFSKVLCKREKKKEITHACVVSKYDEKQECIFLKVEDASRLEDVSLDAIYLCEIQDADCITACTGRVKERYRSAEGNVLRFQIENGFYKINIKSLTNI